MEGIPRRVQTLSTTSTPRRGTGEVESAFVDGASAVVAVAAKSPLKLLVSRERGPCARVHAATFGGGLVAGDEVQLDVRVGPRSALSFGTSAPSKVYRCDDGRESTQALRVAVGEGGLLAIVPGALTCYRGARYRQRTDVRLDRGGSLLLVDVLTSGRSARGERWVFDRYDARTRLHCEGALVLHEALRLHAGAASEPGAVSVAERMGGMNALGFAVLAGPRLATAAQQVYAHIAELPARRGEPVRLAASALPFGVVVRGAAIEPEALTNALRALLAPALEVVAGGGEWHDPW